MDSEEERKRLPEHKWIVNLAQYIQDLRLKIEDAIARDWEYSCVLDYTDMVDDEIGERELLIAKYKKRITPCEQRTYCSKEDCPYFHSKADRLVMKNMKENEQDRLFYLDQFHHLMPHLKLFFMKDIASLIREYCCNPSFLLTKDGIRCSTILNLFYLIGPNRRKAMQVDRFPMCRLCEQQYDQYKETLYNLTKDFDEHNQDYYMLDEDCGRTYLGLNTVSISLSMPMHGWKLSVQKRFPEHKWYINLERYIGQQNEKPYFDFMTEIQYQEWVLDMRRWKALLTIYEERIRSKLQSH